MQHNNIHKQLKKEQQSVAQESSSKKDAKTIFQFVDNRPTSVAQQKLKHNLERTIVQRKQKYFPSNRNQPIQLMKTIPVNEPSEQLLQDPGKSTATRQEWNSKFVIYVYNGKGEVPRVRVVIFITTAADDKVFATWNASIKAAWNKKFSIITAAGINYPVTVEITRATASYSDHTVVNVKASKASAGRGLFGTDHMLRWGEQDPQDIPHEVGHMIGNKDEYGTVDGHNFDAEYDILDSDTHSIMRKGDQPPRMRHFSLVLQKITEDGALGAHPRLVKYRASSGVPITAAAEAEAKKKSSSSTKKDATAAKGKGAASSSEQALRIGGPATQPSEAQAARTLELRQALHARRVKQITDHIMKDGVAESLTEAQSKYLETHDWNNNPDYSAAAKRILGL